jgi:hypothetical protein
MLLGRATKSANGTWIKEPKCGPIFKPISLAPVVALHLLSLFDSWTARPVLEPDLSDPLLKDGVAEPYVLHGPDGKWYLFFTAGLGDNEPRVTMVGVSEDGAFGPWSLSTQPAVAPVKGERAWDACGTFAPTVLVEGNRTRMWYSGWTSARACAHQATLENVAVHRTLRSVTPRPPS